MMRALLFISTVLSVAAFTAGCAPYGAGCPNCGVGVGQPYGQPNYGPAYSPTYGAQAVADPAFGQASVSNAPAGTGGAVIDNSVTTVPAQGSSTE